LVKKRLRRETWTRRLLEAQGGVGVARHSSGGASRPARGQAGLPDSLKKREHLGLFSLDVVFDMHQQLLKYFWKPRVVRRQQPEFLEEGTDGALFPATGGQQALPLRRRLCLARIVKDIGFQVGVDREFQ
jgi:hypothetical protein